jgi:mRNA interferase RelE/StbE
VTGSYSVSVKRSAEKELRGVRGRELRRLIERIRALAEEPRPAGVEKLSTLERYRIRQGDWRILYEIDDGARLVTIVKVGHRKEVYR